MGATLYPADFSNKAIEAVVNPLPIPEITPPETKIYFRFVDFVGCTIYPIKN